MEMMKKEARVVLIPSAGVGHLVPAIELAKHLINRDHRLWITVLLVTSPNDDNLKSSVAYLHSLPSIQRLQLIKLPQTAPPDSDAHSDSIRTSPLESQKPHVKEAVSNLTAPPLAAFVLDMFCTTMTDVAKHFGVPSLIFFASGIASLGLALNLHSLRERDNVEFNLSDDTELAIPSFVKPVPLKVFPSLTVEKQWEAFFQEFIKGLKRADGFIVNSFEELESHALRSFTNTTVYPVGPLLNFNPHASEQEQEDIFKWLDQQPPSSVIFLCFGSMGSFDEDQVKEIACALENTGARFLWSLRKPPPKSSTPITMPSNYTLSDLSVVLPPGFLDRTAGIGKVIGWAPQAQVLAHPATGGFVSHCGWNSTLESIHFGVPIAAWPLYAEQQTNAFQLVCELEMAVEISLDYRVDIKTGPNTLVSAERIEKGIKSLVDLDPEIRKRAKEMSQHSRNTLLEGGSSYSYLGRVIDFLINQV